MAASYVVKSWEVNGEVNQNGNYAEIKGRAPGLIAWFLALMGIAPTVSIFITDKLYIFESGSLSGRFYKTIPISKISSVFYGYSKPWKEALAIAIGLGFFLGSILRSIGTRSNPNTFMIIGILIAVVIAVVYYFLNKKLTLGVFEIGGGIVGINIKRSIIEGKTLDEKDAEQVGNLIQNLLVLKN